ncbi:16145_t:CDS:2, partial [Entrophospora sp. SA101]
VYLEDDKLKQITFKGFMGPDSLVSEFDKDTIIQTTGKFIVEDGKEYLGLIQATTIEEETTIDQLPSSPALLVISARLETINRNGLKKL